VHVDVDFVVWVVLFGCLDCLLFLVVVSWLVGVLFDDVVVWVVMFVLLGFDVWFVVVCCCYCYWLCDYLVDFDLLCWCDIVVVCSELDGVVMDVVVVILVGLVDFVVFCKCCEGVMIVCILLVYGWWWDDDGVFEVCVEVDVFCYLMVCLLVGVVLLVG